MGKIIQHYRKIIERYKKLIDNCQKQLDIHIQEREKMIKKTLKHHGDCREIHENITKL